MLARAQRATSPVGIESQVFGNSKKTGRRPREKGDRRHQKFVTHVAHVTGPESQWFSPYSAVTGLVTGRHRSPLFGPWGRPPPHATARRRDQATTDSPTGVRTSLNHRKPWGPMLRK